MKESVEPWYVQCREWNCLNIDNDIVNQSLAKIHLQCVLKHLKLSLLPCAC